MREVRPAHPGEEQPHLVERPVTACSHAVPRADKLPGMASAEQAQRTCLCQPPGRTFGNLRLAADGGDPAAQRYLGWCYL